MPKLQLEIRNYKTVGSLDFPLEECNLVVVNGSNGAGKTSVINGILENLKVTSMTETPLKHGESKGEYKTIVEDKNGNEIAIIHAFDKKSNKGTFYAIRDKKKISSLKEIRELIGEVNIKTVNEYFIECKSTSGRRSFISDLIMKCLTSKETSRIDEINKSILKNGTLYNKRTDINTRMTIINAMPKLTKEETEKLNSKEEVQAAFDKSEISLTRFNSRKKSFMDLKTSVDSFVTRIGEVSMKDFNFLKDPHLSNVSNILDPFNPESIKKFNATYNAYLQAIIDNLTLIADKKTQDKNILDEIANIEYKKKDYEGTDKELLELQQDLTDTQKEMNDLSEEKDKILEASNLPAGFKIDSESEFSYNGFEFNEHNISESEGWLAIAEIIFNVYDSKYVKMGNAAIYDDNSMQKIIALAKKHDKLVALERVVSDTEVYVEGVLIDEGYSNNITTGGDISQETQKEFETLITSEEVLCPSKEKISFDDSPEKPIIKEQIIEVPKEEVITEKIIIDDFDDFEKPIVPVEEKPGDKFMREHKELQAKKAAEKNKPIDSVSFEEEQNDFESNSVDKKIEAETFEKPVAETTESTEINSDIKVNDDSVKKLNSLFGE